MNDRLSSHRIMRRLRFPAVAVAVVFFAAACSGKRYHLVENPAVETIGVPVRSVNWVRLHEGRDGSGNPAVYATMGQNADNLFMLRIDPETGEYLQYHSAVEKSNYPTATCVSRTGRLYIGAAYAGHLLCYDPYNDSLEDLGAINPGKASFPCAITEDSKGIIWIGSYGACDLTSYNPANGEFVRHGRMDDTDMYCYPAVNADGMICCKIMMTRPHLLVFDPRTGIKRVVGPVTVKNRDTFNIVEGAGGRLFIVSSLGNYRIDGFTAVPVDSIPPVTPEPSPGGLTFSFADAGSQLYRTLEVRSSDGETRTFDLGYEAAGNDIFYLHRGPDDRIYGSSILPLHLFRYDPASDGLDDLGKCSASTGEAYSMANLGGSMYIASYPGARVSVYNPALPYSYGAGADDNPRELGRIDDISYRPRSTLAGPMGCVWFASIPDYGVWGGPLSRYNPATGEKKTYHRIAGDASCYTLAHLKKQAWIAVGTTISGGTGTKPKVDNASLFLWDYEAEEKIWEGSPDRTVTAINALCTAPDGRLFGTAIGGEQPEIFVFDPVKRTFGPRIEPPDGRPLDLGLQVGPDGFIYGFTSSCFYRIKPSNMEIKVIVREYNVFDIAGPILGNTVFFADGHLLKAIRIFE